jgi:hypothetical protein
MTQRGFPGEEGQPGKPGEEGKDSGEGGRGGEGGEGGVGGAGRPQGPGGGGGEGGEGGGGGEPPSIPPVTQTKDAAEVVTGGTSISVSIPGEEPPCGEIEPCEEPGGSGPNLNLGGKSAFKLSTALKRGVKLTLRTSEAGRATVKALVDRKTARRLKIKKNAKGPVVVAAATKRVHSGRNTVKLVFTKKARKRLKHAKRVKLAIRATIRSVEGNTATDRFKLTLKRKLR